MSCQKAKYITVFSQYVCLYIFIYIESQLGSFIHKKTYIEVKVKQSEMQIYSHVHQCIDKFSSVHVLVHSKCS